MKNLDDLKPGDRVFYGNTGQPEFEVVEVSLQARGRNGRTEFVPMVLLKDPGNPNWRDDARACWAELAHVETREERAAKKALEHLAPSPSPFDVAKGAELDRIGLNWGMVRTLGEPDWTFRLRVIAAVEALT